MPTLLSWPKSYSSLDFGFDCSSMGNQPSRVVPTSLYQIMSYGACCIVCGFLQSFGHCCSLFVLKFVQMFSACTCCPVNIAATRVHAALWTLLQHRCTCCAVNITATQVYMLSCEHCCNTGFDYDAKFAWIVKFCTANLVCKQTCILMYDDHCTIQFFRMYLWYNLYIRCFC